MYFCFEEMEYIKIVGEHIRTETRQIEKEPFITNSSLFKYKKSKSVIRDFFINDKKIDLAKNFDDSHTDCYLKILEKKDNIFTVSNVKKSLELVLDLKKQI